MKEYLGIDIGGTAVKMGIVAEDGSVRARREASVSFDGYKTPILTTVQAEAAILLLENEIDPAALHGIGVSATGQIDTNTGTVAGTGGNFPGWTGVAIGPALENQLRLPATVANDVNCVCMGEVWQGAGKGCTDLLCVALGTGVGGGILCGGRLLDGMRGLGGELGHMITHGTDGILCGCGNRGCWEKYASVTALVARARQQDATLVNGREIFARAAAGDAAVLALLDSWMDEIAIGLVSLVHVFNPQRILIGGGVSGQRELLIDPLEAKVRSRLLPAFAQGLTLQAAALGNDAGLVGAVYNFRQKHPECC